MTRIRLARAALAVVLILGTAACSAGGDPVQTPATETLSPEPTPTGSPEGSVPVGDGSTVELVDAPGQWQAIATGEIDGAVIPVFDGELLVTSEAHGAGGRDLTVMRSDSGDAVFSYDPPSGFLVESAWLTGHWLVIEEVPYEAVDFSGRILRVDLESGEQQDVVDPEDAARLTSPEMDVSGDVLVYIGAAVGGGECLVQVSVATLATRERFCVPPDEFLGDPFVARDATVTFTTLSGYESDGGQRCKTLHTMRSADTSPSRVPAVAECTQWSGIMLDEVVLWSETLPDETVSESDGYIRFADGTMAGIGTVLTDTFRACGDAIFWVAFEDERPSSPQQIRRWTAGDDVIEVVFAAASIDEIPSYISCGDGEVAVSSVTHFAPDGTTSIALTSS